MIQLGRCLGAVSLVMMVGSSQDTRPPVLIVQVVDRGWLPIPGMLVSVESVVDAKTRPSARTDVTGFARFFVSDNAKYRVAVPDQGGFRGESLEVKLYDRSASAPTAYVQLRILETKQHIEIE